VSPWGIVLYLILADVQNTVLSAWLVFAERLIYPSYAAVSHAVGDFALNDQAAAERSCGCLGPSPSLYPSPGWSPAAQSEGVSDHRAARSLWWTAV